MAMGDGQDGTCLDTICKAGLENRTDSETEAVTTPQKVEGNRGGCTRVEGGGTGWGSSGWRGNTDWGSEALSRSWAQYLCHHNQMTPP